MSTSAATAPVSPSVVLVGVDFGLPLFDHGLEELGLLAKTAGFAVAERVTCKRRAPDPALFVGSGKAEEIRMLAQSTGASEVLFDVFGSAVPAHAFGGKSGGAAFGQRPEVMFAGFDTNVPLPVDSFTITKKVSVPSAFQPRAA